MALQHSIHFSTLKEKGRKEGGRREGGRREGGRREGGRREGGRREEGGRKERGRREEGGRKEEGGREGGRREEGGRKERQSIEKYYEQKKKLISNNRGKREGPNHGKWKEVTIKEKKRKKRTYIYIPRIYISIFRAAKERGVVYDHTVDVTEHAHEPLWSTAVVLY